MYIKVIEELECHVGRVKNGTLMNSMDLTLFQVFTKGKYSTGNTKEGVD